MWAAFLSWIPAIVLRVLTALGIALVTYEVSDTALDAIISQIQGSIGGLPADVAALVSLSGVDTAFSMLISAHLTALAIRAAVASMSFGKAAS